MAKAFRVKLKRSLIGTSKSQRDTVRCLGLRKINQEVVVADNPANRGQIYKVQHLLDVKPEN
ncbi:MAG: 50S ribosomal protein L30 [Bdellovibrionaceae bacterium]|nr:50S ribosomal protein L30 [Bdellovibrionales bacterium]MCB9084655.1 50S ribosomal protein L30 [Pseudobdellovibrionaceae bacterium]